MHPEMYVPLCKVPLLQTTVILHPRVVLIWQLCSNFPGPGAPSASDNLRLCHVLDMYSTSLSAKVFRNYMVTSGMV